MGGGREQAKLELGWWLWSVAPCALVVCLAARALVVRLAAARALVVRLAASPCHAVKALSACCPWPPCPPCPLTPLSAVSPSGGPAGGTQAIVITARCHGACAVKQSIYKLQQAVESSTESKAWEILDLNLMGSNRNRDHIEDQPPKYKPQICQQS